MQLALGCITKRNPQRNLKRYPRRKPKQNLKRNFKKNPERNPTRGGLGVFQLALGLITAQASCHRSCPKCTASAWNWTTQECNA